MTSRDHITRVAAVTDRRALLRGALGAGTGALLAAATTGCGTAAPSPNPATASATSATPTKVLMAYFSRAGENYADGGRTVLPVGNTQVLAEMIASLVAVDVFRIEGADPYPDSYDATVERNVREQDTEARPAIATALPMVTGYDTVLLGSGIWNVQPPMIMRTFVEGVDLTGATIVPFVTYAVSGLGRTITNYTRLCPRSTIADGLAVRGEQVRQARPQAQAWLHNAGLL